LVIANFYPNFSEFEADDPPSLIEGATTKYLIMVGVQVLIAACLLGFFRKTYLRQFPLSASWLSVLVGVVGVVLWIGVCELQLEKNFFEAVGLTSLASTRPAFNPFEMLPEAGLRTLFLGLRFTLLALIVPIVEELFLRGWLVRWVQDPEFESVSLKQLSWTALLTPSVYGVLTHPSEAIAAFLWFGLVTLLMRRTGSLWDCVIAHAVTNLLLGIYVVQFEAWHLW
jgi:CAAX prenyl protease-like protein